jgi:hypothetical protein
MLILIMLLTCLISCKTIDNNGVFAPPQRPKLHWQDDGNFVYLSKIDAVKLAQYFIDIDAYIKKTQ